MHNASDLLSGSFVSPYVFVKWGIIIYIFALLPRVPDSNNGSSNYIHFSSTNFLAFTLSNALITTVLLFQNSWESGFSYDIFSVKNEASSI